MQCSPSLERIGFSYLSRQQRPAVTTRVPMPRTYGSVLQHSKGLAEGELAYDIRRHEQAPLEHVCGAAHLHLFLGSLNGKPHA